MVDFLKLGIDINQGDPSIKEYLMDISWISDNPRVNVDRLLAGEDDAVSPADDESVLTLSDGSTVPAAKLEEILKKHLEAVEHVMVVGSGKEFLSCMLTLKTKGSEAVAQGEYPAALGPAKDERFQDVLASRFQDVLPLAQDFNLALALSEDELAQDALALAQQVGSDATTVQDARKCSKFLDEGLQPLFAKANAEINLSTQQVAILLQMSSSTARPCLQMLYPTCRQHGHYMLAMTLMFDYY